MTGRTHLLVGLAAGMGVAHVVDAQGVLLAIFVAAGGIGGLLPDIDHHRSIAARYTPGVGHAARLFMSHRGPTHTLLGLLVVMAMVAMLAAPMGYLPFMVASIAAVGAGYALHLLCDMATPAGVPLLMPLSNRAWRIAPRGVLWASAWMIESVVTVAALTVIVGLLAIEMGVL